MSRAGPLVSVVIPTYDRADHIPKAIDSALAQTYRSLEIVVIDDGSTDATPEVISRYGDAVRYHRQANRGISAARNAGIAMARGEWLAFLDSDDWWQPQKLERQMALAEAHPEYGLIACACRSVLPGRPGSRPSRSGPSGWVLEEIFRRNYVRTSTVLVARRCIDEVGGFDESLEEAEDYDLVLRVAAAFPVGFVPEPLACYLDNPEGVSVDSLRGRLFRLRALEKPYLRDRIPPGLYSRRIAYMCFRIGRSYLRRGREEEAAPYLDRAVALRPWSLKYRFFRGNRRPGRGRTAP